MSVIEKHIHEHFARLAEEGSTEEPTPNGTNGASQTLPTRSVPQPLGPPFARVNSVVVGSPADAAGLKAGDEIRNFGYVNITNHENLRRVGDCVQGNEGVRDLYNCQLACWLFDCSARYLSKYLALRMVGDRSSNLPWRQDGTGEVEDFWAVISCHCEVWLGPFNEFSRILDLVSDVAWEALWAGKNIQLQVMDRSSIRYPYL